LSAKCHKQLAQLDADLVNMASSVVKNLRKYQPRLNDFKVRRGGQDSVLKEVVMQQVEGSLSESTHPYVEKPAVYISPKQVLSVRKYVAPPHLLAEML
jgi:hypothetical protein